ncbi:MAG: zinc finger domain-containing protein [Planctomycetia bacterium]
MSHTPPPSDSNHAAADQAVGPSDVGAHADGAPTTDGAAVERKPPTTSRAPERFPCHGCAAELQYEPGASQLKCPYCGYVQELAAAEGTVEENDVEEYLARAAAGRLGAGVGDLRNEVTCQSCAAVVLLDAKTVADACPYCTSRITNQPREAGEMIQPSAVLPFVLDRREALDAFRLWLNALWFAPSDLKKLATTGEVHGLYVPHWTFDSMTYSSYTGQRGDDYWVSESYTERDAQGNTVTKTRQVRHTAWTSVSGRVDHWFDDVLVPASRTLPIDTMRNLQPWDLPKLEPFQTAFLAGFRTERYQIGLDAGLVDAKEIMAAKIDALCRSDIGGDHQRVSSIDTRHVGVTFKHLLLPVWHSAYRYREKLWHIIINARTGEVQGERPISWWKVAGAVLLAAGAVAAVVALANGFGG